MRMRLKGYRSERRENEDEKRKNCSEEERKSARERERKTKGTRGDGSESRKERKRGEGFIISTVTSTPLDSNEKCSPRIQISFATD